MDSKQFSKGSRSKNSGDNKSRAVDQSSASVQSAAQEAINKAAIANANHAADAVQGMTTVALAVRMVADLPDTIDRAAELVNDFFTGIANNDYDQILLDQGTNLFMLTPADVLPAPLPLTEAK